MDDINRDWEKTNQELRNIVKDLRRLDKVEEDNKLLKEQLRLVKESREGIQKSYDIVAEQFFASNAIIEELEENLEIEENKVEELLKQFVEMHEVNNSLIISLSEKEAELDAKIQELADVEALLEEQITLKDSYKKQIDNICNMYPSNKTRFTYHVYK